MKKQLFISFFLALFISIPVIVSMLNGTASRLSVVSVFSYPRSEDQVAHILQEDSDPQAAYSLYHSETLNFLRVILGKWFNVFSARFLFFEGDWENPRFSSPYSGEILLIESVLLLLGLIKLLRNLNNKYLIFTLIWFLTAPLPAILSRDQVHSARSLNMTASLVILEALGLYFLIVRAKLYKAGRLVLLTFTALYLINYSYYLDSYYIHLPKHNAKYWDYGYREAVNYLRSYQSKTIVFQQSYEQPFIYFLFYWKMDQIQFQKNVAFQESSVGDVGLVKSISGNISFVGLSAPFQFPKDTLVVADTVAAPLDLMQNSYITLKEIKYPGDKEVALRIFEAK